MLSGINEEAQSVSNSMQKLANRIRIDEKDLNWNTNANLSSEVNKKINAQTAVAFKDNTLDDMANATYSAMSRALFESNEDNQPYVNVYLGNEKLYSGFSNYQNEESNMYGVKI